MFLPTTHKEMEKRGWSECDVVIATPDAYVDHPSFAMAILGRFLEKYGYKVGILTQPRWQEPESFLELGVPKIAFAISGGNMDSMVINYTASMKPRKEDPFCENGNPYFSSKGDPKKYRIRPDRVVTVYSNQIRSVCREKPVIIGGVEASLRRIAHYDYWSNKVKRSVLFDAKAQMLIYGMGEYPLLNTVRAVESGIPFEEMEIKNTAVICKEPERFSDVCNLPSYTDVKNDKQAFASAFCGFYQNGDRKILAQQQDTRYLLQFPRQQLKQPELDGIYDLNFERRPHPRFKKIPSYDMIKYSVTAHRGCYGNCSFCSIAAHQGPGVVSRSKQSILKEVRTIAKSSAFRGTITDIGGPSANMYASYCKTGGCEHPDCLKRGKACPNLVDGLKEYLELLNDAGKVDDVRHIFISSGLRFDPCLMNESFLSQVLSRHISGQMKVAPESGSDTVLKIMNKPDTEIFGRFKKLFDSVTKRENIRKYLIPYIIIGHPGESEAELDETRKFLREYKLKGNQFQVFTPTPLTRATAMYYLGYDPCTGKKVPVEKNRNVLEKRKSKLLNR